ncbi:hypothetical protein EPUS_06747 [Endocarpon pusillum Z07020]|uniref:Ribonucleotide reductase large subunit C-terminal domain-containing protein n=1 Tax=Endocarpon pusillum (strain Z07020 / HMAS-L-300199) TaxID=1263415 RepID=U1G158_ENDPU|nr:uncharacterized protein EPUS_06747 [Endocarpon pusillum Z07020]ERF70962.1 hypothetical protein EPUS_06747 [Endocarpon pusillum Z07020]
MKNRIIADGGSVQNIPNIPADIKALYKTVWEISQRTIVQMAADRGAFIDQSQSLNIHLKEPTMGKITSMHFAGWKLGLKTGMYYLRTMAASAPIQFTVDQEQLQVVDTNVARQRAAPKKRLTSSGYNGSYAAIPRPMYAQKGSGHGSATSVNMTKFVQNSDRDADRDAHGKNAFYYSMVEYLVFDQLIPAAAKSNK